MESTKKELTTGKEYSFYGNGITICTFLTVISQLPQLVDMGVSSSISRIVWIAFFGIVMLAKKGRIEVPTTGLVFIGGYVFFSLLVSAFTDRADYETSLFSSIILSFFIFLVGLGIGKDITEKDLLRCGKAYVIASIVLALTLYFTIFDTYDITNRIYGYASKNSAGVILLTALLIALVYGWKPQKRLNNLINLAIIALLLYMVLVMKVRAMIVCIPVIALVVVVKAPFRKSIRLPIILLCVAVLILLQNEKVYDLLINNILFANRGDDLASASSGRFDEWLTLFDDLQGKELLGDGSAKRESLILTALLQCGIPMGVVIIAYAVWPLKCATYWSKQDKSNNMFMLLLVALVYSIDAIFEQLAPFGPGARCFYLWLLFGILQSRNVPDTTKGIKSHYKFNNK